MKSVKCTVNNDILAILSTEVGLHSVYSSANSNAQHPSTQEEYTGYIFSLQTHYNANSTNNVICLSYYYLLLTVI